MHGFSACLNQSLLRYAALDDLGVDADMEQHFARKLETRLDGFRCAKSCARFLEPAGMFRVSCPGMDRHHRPSAMDLGDDMAGSGRIVHGHDKRCRMVNSGLGEDLAPGGIPKKTG